jgi:hypothetical protein
MGVLDGMESNEESYNIRHFNEPRQQITEIVVMKNIERLLYHPSDLNIINVIILDSHLDPSGVLRWIDILECSLV